MARARRPLTKAETARLGRNIHLAVALVSMLGTFLLAWHYVPAHPWLAAAAGVGQGLLYLAIAIICEKLFGRSFRNRKGE